MLRLAPGELLLLDYTVPRRGVVEFDVLATRPVTTCVLDDAGAVSLQVGDGCAESYGGFANRQRHRQVLQLPFRGRWYLVIDNPSDEGADVEYEVRY